MKRYTLAEFTADFPDDQIEDTDGKIAVLGGRNVADAIAAALRRAGYEVGPPEYMDEHGWDLNIHPGGKWIWLELQGGPTEFVLQTEAMGFFARLFRADLSYYEEFLTKLNEELRRDARFGPLRWYQVDNNYNRIGDPSDDPLRVRG